MGHVTSKTDFKFRADRAVGSFFAEPVYFCIHRIICKSTGKVGVVL